MVEVGDRERVEWLFVELRVALPELEKLLSETSRASSLEVLGLQTKTRRIVEALGALAPDLSLNSRFVGVVRRGMGKASSASPTLAVENAVDAFQHARFFLELAIACGREQAAAPKVASTGWATLLHLYNLH